LVNWFACAAERLADPRFDLRTQHRQGDGALLQDLRVERRERKPAAERRLSLRSQCQYFGLAYFVGHGLRVRLPIRVDPRIDY